MFKCVDALMSFVKFSSVEILSLRCFVNPQYNDKVFLTLIVTYTVNFLDNLYIIYINYICTNQKCFRNSLENENMFNSPFSLISR